MSLQKELHKQLLDLLKGGNAHVDFEKALHDFPAEKRGIKPAGLPYSAWQLLEHMRITQEDILRFSTNHDGKYKALDWPDDYWPKSADPPNAKAWDESLRRVKHDREEFEKLLEDPKADLTTPFPWGDGQNLLREALLIADHNAYHLGELVAVRRILGAWHS